MELLLVRADCGGQGIGLTLLGRSVLPSQQHHGAKYCASTIFEPAQGRKLHLEPSKLAKCPKACARQSGGQVQLGARGNNKANAVWENVFI